MMMARSMLAFEGVGVKLGVKVGSGVKVTVLVGGIVGGSVAVDVSMIAGDSLGYRMLVGEGAGRRELPQIFGTDPQPVSRKNKNTRVMRFRENSPVTISTLAF